MPDLSFAIRLGAADLMVLAASLLAALACGALAWALARSERAGGRRAEAVARAVTAAEAEIAALGQRIEAMAHARQAEREVDRDEVAALVESRLAALDTRLSERMREVAVAAAGDAADALAGTMREENAQRAEAALATAAETRRAEIAEAVARAQDEASAVLAEEAAAVLRAAGETATAAATEAAARARQEIGRDAAGQVEAALDRAISARLDGAIAARLEPAATALEARLAGWLEEAAARAAAEAPATSRPGQAQQLPVQTGPQAPGAGPAPGRGVVGVYAGRGR